MQFSSKDLNQMNSQILRKIQAQSHAILIAFSFILPI